MITKEQVYDVIYGMIREIEVSTDRLTDSDKTMLDTLLWVLREIKKIE